MEAEDPKEQDIKDVLEEERSRGSRRKRIDSEERRRQATFRTRVLATIRNRDEAGLINVLREGEIPDGTPEFERILQIFRATLGPRPPK
jgi:hypothetical protein